MTATKPLPPAFTGLALVLLDIAARVEREATQPAYNGAEVNARLDFSPNSDRREVQEDEHGQLAQR